MLTLHYISIVNVEYGRSECVIQVFCQLKLEETIQFALHLHIFILILNKLEKYICSGKFIYAY